jgi:hypothetical protein
MTLSCLLFVLATSSATIPSAPAPTIYDPRNIRNGLVIPDEGYCDQPYVVITKDGNWLCTLTTGKGKEGEPGQHVVATISSDKGKTWSKLIDIEPADGPQASWAMPLVTPSGRVYVFYDYNGDRVDSLGDKKNIRADMLGWFVYKYSDDNGRSWSKERYRLPIRETEIDRQNDWRGKVQMLWSISKPITVGQSVYLGFSKIGKYLVEKSEGWFLRSDNILTEPDPNKHVWQMLPEGDVGLRSPSGPIAEEQNLVALSSGALYAVYRTVDGYPCHAYSRDGKSWTAPAFATYTPGGQPIKNPRACPRLWKAKNGKYLLWYHNHSGVEFTGRNPAWLTGGVEKDGFIHWSQPEIVLYDPGPLVRISYPDLIEQDGRYWITATQKSVARVHEIDPGLLEGLWNQGTDKTIARKGLVLTFDGSEGKPATAPMPKLPKLDEGGAFTLDLWVRTTTATPGQAILDNRDEANRGFVLGTGKDESLRFAMYDGNLNAYWDSDPHTLQLNCIQHVVVIVDGGPKILSFIIEGVLCDGGPTRQFGWVRFDPQMDDLNGRKDLLIAPRFSGQVMGLRIYDRCLRTSEAVAHYLAGPQAKE